MGLLGGFKGKLIGNKVKKIKNSGSVVCVKFNTFSEFGPSTSYNTPSSSNNIGRNEVIKERRRTSKPEIKQVFEQMPKPQPPKTPHSEVKFVNTSSETKSKQPIANITNQPSINSQPTSTIKSANTDNQISPIKLQPPSENSELKTPNTTQSQPLESKTFEEKTPTKTIFPLNQDDDSDNDSGNFKIHYVNNNSGATLSESEESWADENDLSISMNYSSQAASIFFGGEEEPMTTRPRNIVLDDDNDYISDSSSASA